MKIIVGLGNYGKEYEKTYHNLGFMCIDKVAESLGVSFSIKKCRSLIAETKINGEKVLLVKPQTYMNLSGEAVREIISFYKSDINDLIVIYDDVDLSMGAVRLREKGSAGTHNGMRNIISQIGSGDFKRIRLGFKPNEESNYSLINYVLSKITKENLETIMPALEIGASAVLDFIKGESFQNIMQKYNTKAKK